MLSTQDRLRMSAIINELLDSDFDDSETQKRLALKIIEFGQQIVVSPDKLTFRRSSWRSRRDGGMTGLTDMGEVNLKECSGNKRRVKTYTSEVQERVGQYKIWRSPTFIRLRHFWKAEINTSGDIDGASQEYEIGYSENMEPTYLARLHLETIFSFLKIKIFKKIREIVWGESKDLVVGFGFSIRR